MDRSVMRHATMSYARNAIAAILPLVLGCSTTGQAEEILADPSRAEGVPIVLRICGRIHHAPCDRDCSATVRVLEVLKNDTPTSVPDVVTLSFASIGPHVPEGVSTVYVRSRTRETFQLDEEPRACRPGWSHEHPKRAPYPTSDFEKYGPMCPQYQHLDPVPSCEPDNPLAPLETDPQNPARRITSP